MSLPRFFTFIGLLFSTPLWAVVPPEATYIVAQTPAYSGGSQSLVVYALETGFLPALHPLFGETYPQLFAQVAFLESNEAVPHFIGLDSRGQILFRMSSGVARWLHGEYSAVHAIQQDTVMLVRNDNRIFLLNEKGQLQPATGASWLDANIYGKIVQVQKIAFGEYVMRTSTHLILAHFQPQSGFQLRDSLRTSGSVAMIANENCVWLKSNSSLTYLTHLSGLRIAASHVLTSPTLELLDIDPSDNSLLGREDADYVRHYRDQISSDRTKVELGGAFKSLPAKAEVIVDHPRSGFHWSTRGVTRGVAALGFYVTTLNRDAFKNGISRLPRQETALQFKNRVNASDALRFEFKDVPAAELSRYGLYYLLGDLMVVPGKENQKVDIYSLFQLLNCQHLLAGR